MTSFRIQEILKATKGSLFQKGAEGFCGISIDSRTLRQGELFVALRGKHFDGHDFVQEAVRRGAKGILISKRCGTPSKTTTVIFASDTLSALGKVAAFHRRRFSIPVIAVTGSNGKTTTKEIIAHILSGKGSVLKNEGTKNNAVGVPLTLLDLQASHRYAILELGMNQRGEIGSLSRMVSPTMGIITNIGPAHLGNLGTLEAVFLCKMEILEGLQKKGTLLLNQEDPFLRKVRSRSHRILYFGQGSLFSASTVRQKGRRTFFRFNGRLEGNIPLVGSHHVDNALAAMAAAALHGIPLSFSIERLKNFRGLGGRMTVRRVHGIDFIDDSYNANPESTRCALESLVDMPTRGRRIFVMGDMLELGKKTPAYHAALGEEVAALGVDLLMTVGVFSRKVSERARAFGMNGQRVSHFETPHDAARELLKKAGAGDRVLVKGSRGMRMEEVIRIFGGSRVRGFEGS